MSPNWEHLSTVAQSAARQAGALIQSKLATEVAVEHKNSGSSYATQVVTAVDQAAEKIILDHLRPTCKKYDLALLSEEAPDDGSRLVKDYFWCIDPLDGTLAFIEKRPDFAVSIGLVAQDGTPMLGVVYDPSRDNLYHALAGQGAFKNGRPWHLPPPNKHLTYVTDHPLEKAVGQAQIKKMIAQKAAELGKVKTQIITGGGLVINAMRTAENRPAFMMKVPKPSPGGGSLWDYAAVACIATELGLEVRAYTGEPLDLNKKENTFLNHQGMWFGCF
jgi:fructose-1,6-bisphosphatase/inositol monophosphatase family enzyme